MPDIVSRIKLEAQGADQAAREILKLKEAYEQTATAARGLSPSGGISGDPFQRATSATPTIETSGYAAERERRNDVYRQQQRQRESDNLGYNAGLRQLPGTVSRGVSAAEKVGASRYSGALGGALSALGGLLGGPLGAGAMALGALAIGVQAFSEKTEERLKTFYGSGMAQRLGRPMTDLTELTLWAGRSGIPTDAMMQFWQTAGSSGVDLSRPSALDAVRTAFEAQSRIGADPSATAALMGALSRGGVHMGNVLRPETFNTMAGTWGQPNVNMFISTITQAFTEAMQQGINITTDLAQRQIAITGMYAAYGGLSPEGAAALSRTGTTRGRQAATLQRPEDVVAFQRMSQLFPGKSISEIQLLMEQQPNLVNIEMFRQIRSTSGGNKELIRQRMQSALGSGTTMSQTVAMINTLDRLLGKDGDADYARDPIGFLSRASTAFSGTYAGKIDWESLSGERSQIGLTQAASLRNLENLAFSAATNLTKLAQFFTGTAKGVTMKGIGWSGYIPPEASAEAKSMDALVNAATSGGGSFAAMIREEWDSGRGYGGNRAGIGSAIVQSFIERLEKERPDLARGPRNQPTELYQALSSIQQTLSVFAEQGQYGPGDERVLEELQKVVQLLSSSGWVITSEEK